MGQNGFPLNKYIEMKERRTVKQRILNYIDSFFDIITTILFRLFKIIDKGHLSRRVAVWAGIILTIQVAYWCMAFVMHPPVGYTGTEVATIIATIMTPLSLLTGALMKFSEQYKDKKRVSSEDDTPPSDDSK